MTFRQSEKQIKKDFNLSIKDGIFWVLMNSIAVVFLIPYIISLGATPFQVGFIQSFPIFITSFLVLISYRLLKIFNSKKNAVVVFITLQALLWIPLGVAHFFFKNSVVIWIVILIYTLITGAGIVVNPIYMDWIRKLFPVSKMGFFIARKNIILSFISIVPIFLIGYFLDFMKTKNSLIGYSIIFICAGFFRFISSRFLNKMDSTEDKAYLLKLVEEKRNETLFKSFKKNILKDRPFLRFLIFSILAYIGIYLATSYVAYFILNSLHYTSVQYIWWQIAYILGTVLSLSYWGYISDKYSPAKVLQISSLFLPFFLLVPAFLYDNYFLMIYSIFVAGVIFGAFNLSIVNYLYKNVKKDLIAHTSYFIIIQSTAIFIGTLIGAFIIKSATKYYNSEFKALIFLFIFAAIFRLIPFLYSLKLENLSRRDLRFFKYVVFQRPVFYGILDLTSLSHEDKNILLNLEIKKEIRNIEEKFKLKHFFKFNFFNQKKR